VILRLEVAVHGAQSHVGFSGHVLHLNLVVIVGSEKDQSRFHDAVPALALAAT
jgi:hypothetical protein